MKSDLVYLEKKDHIATMYLNRADKRNALNYQMWATITKLMEQCEADRDVKG